VTQIDILSRPQAFEQRLQALLPRLACFDANDYLDMHPDLAGIDPFRHFAEHGLWEKRRCITPERLTAKLARATVVTPPVRLGLAAMKRAYSAAMSVTAVLYIPAKPSDLERRIAERLARLLYAVGLDVPIRKGKPKPGAASTAGAIIVGPERLFDGAWDETDRAFLSTALVVASVTPEQPVFGGQLLYLLGAAGVLAVESETYVLCQDAGIPAVYLGALSDEAPEDLESISHPLFFGLSRAVRAAAPQLPWADRPIDVLSIEPGSLARTAAWARLAEGLTCFNSVVYQPPADVALDDVEIGLRRYLYTRSKIVLHLHEDASSALSSSLVEEAAWAGAVVLTEPARPHLLLKPEQNYFESSARRMPALIERLLGEADAAAQASAAIATSRRILASAFDPETVGLALINLLSDTKGSPHD
jgi:hypothetical protein